MRYRLSLFTSLCAPVLGAIFASSGLAGEGPATAELLAPELAVRHVITSYGRAIEARDVELFRSVMPGITFDAERRLRESFKTIQSQQVGITVEFVDIGGKTATVRALRDDTVDGLRMKPVQQVFHLVLLEDGWRIHSLSVGH